MDDPRSFHVISMVKIIACKKSNNSDTVKPLKSVF